MTFVELFAEALEIEPHMVCLSDKLQDLDQWDSMAALSVIAFAAQRYGKSVNGDQLEMCITVADVERLVVS